MKWLKQLSRRNRGTPSSRRLNSFRPTLELLDDRITPSTVSSITASFNGTAIPAGDTVWFNSAFTASGLPKSGSVTIHADNGMISFTAGGQAYNVAVPNGVIVLTVGANASSSTVSFDPNDNDWDVSAPAAGAGDVFLNGVALPVGANLPGGIKNVTWTEDFWADTAGVTVNWKWGAAVYKPGFGTDYNSLGVKPIDAKGGGGFNNGDQSGTPEAFKSLVTAGALGGGGTNYTGNFTGAKAAKPTLGDGLQDYPYASSNPLTSVAFNESTVLKASYLDTTNGFLDVWYSDEHAMTLGVRQVNVITSSGTTTTNYALSPLTANPSTVVNPAVGAPYTPSTDQGTLIAEGSTDVSGRPMTPTLFITDVTNNPNARDGDWQWGGVGYAPSQVFGTWKGAVRTVNNTTATPTVTVTCDADPAQNGWNLGPGADPVPAGVSGEGYGTEVKWDLNALYQSGVLKAGHNYRFYVMVHDGDQNKSGGDSGQAAYNYTYPGPTNQGISLSGTVFVDADHDGQMDNGETGVGGVLITLTGTDLNGNQITLTTTTNNDGTYSFSGLMPGTYSLSQSLPFFLQGEVASPGTVGGNTDGTAQDTSTISGIILNPGDIGINFNFADVARGG